MTRYTNVGWKRAYHQASFDPNDDQIARSTPSASVAGSFDAAATSHTQFESTMDKAGPNRKRRRKSEADSEPKVAAGSTLTANEDKTNSSATEKKRKKVLVRRSKLKAKEKTRRIKSA